MKITFEGTPEEIARAFPGVAVFPPLGGKLPYGKSAAELDSAGAAPVEPNDGFVSVDVARRVLTRLPLAPEQLLVLQTLHAEHPRRIATADLAATVNYARSQFTGLMGAFGRRVANTPGLVPGMAFFDTKRSDGSNFYTLPESVREAMRLEKLTNRTEA